MRETIRETTVDQQLYEPTLVGAVEFAYEHSLRSPLLEADPPHPAAEYTDQTITEQSIENTTLHYEHYIEIVYNREATVKEAVVAMGDSLELQPDLQTLEAIYRTVDKQEATSNLSEEVETPEHIVAADVLRPEPVDTEMIEKREVLDQLPTTIFSEDISAAVMSFEIPKSDPFFASAEAEPELAFEEYELDTDMYFEEDVQDQKQGMLKWAGTLASRISNAFAIVLGTRRAAPQQKIGKPATPVTQASDESLSTQSEVKPQENNDYVQQTIVEPSVPRQQIARRPKVEPEISYNEATVPVLDSPEFINMPAYALIQSSDAGQLVSASPDD